MARPAVDRASSEPRLQANDLRVAVDTTPALIHTTRPDGSVDFVNQGWLDFVGLPAEDLLGWGWANSFHPDDIEGCLAKWRHALATGEPFEAEARLRRADGVYRTMLHRKAPLRDESSQIIKWYGSSIDVEDLRRTEAELRESEKRFRMAIDTIPGLVWSALPDGHIDFLNQRWLDYTGMTLGQAGGWGWQAAIHPDDVDGLVVYWKSILASGTPGETVARLRQFDGNYRWFLFRGVPLYDAHGTLVKWYGQTTDIHDRKLAEVELQNALEQIKELRDQLFKENIALREEVDKASMFEEIVGKSDALQSVLVQVGKVAPTDSTVLITGETGTGKELIARAIHKRSVRSSRAFVTVNCSAIPSPLIASELFGHEKGAFTGALQRRLGRFELAEGGTIFLDEIGELPPEIQVALLRVLQEKEFERVGGGLPIPSDVRVIAATNRDLQTAITNGSFRKDLYYRLNVFPIELPALVERASDIPLLVEYFIDRFSRKAGKKIDQIEKRTLERLQSCSWPGNIRELQNVIERAVIVCESRTFRVDPSWLTIEPAGSRAARSLSVDLAAQEKEIIERALLKTAGRVSGPSGAASLLGMPASTLESKIKALRINKYKFKKY